MINQSVRDSLMEWPTCDEEKEEEEDYLCGSNDWLWSSWSSLYEFFLQVGQVILSMPTSYSQMGYKWGVFFQIFYFSIGMYTCYLLARLYVEYRVRKERDGVDFNRHVIQVFFLSPPPPPFFFFFFPPPPPFIDCVNSILALFWIWDFAPGT